jgi:hypothetical protein
MRELTQITVNGRAYRSVDEMPPDVRAEYEQAMQMLADKDGNGVPDILERGETLKSANGKSVTVTKFTSTTHALGDRSILDRQPPFDIEEVIRRAELGDVGRNTVQMPVPTLLALLATVAVIGSAVMWYVLQR